MHCSENSKLTWSSLLYRVLVSIQIGVICGVLAYFVDFQRSRGRDFRRYDAYDFCAKICALARRLRHTWRAAVAAGLFKRTKPLLLELFIHELFINSAACYVPWGQQQRRHFRLP
jgi:hypothetical protein